MPRQRRRPASAGSWLGVSAVAALAAVAVLSSGCFAPAYENGRLRCREGECPEGYYCASGSRCWRQGTVPPLSEGDGEAPSDGPPRTDAAVPFDSGGINPIDTGGDQPVASPPDADEPDATDDPTARLLSFEVTPGQLSPPFSPTLNNYALDLPLFTQSITVKATALDPGATLLLNTSPFANVVDAPVPIPPGLSKVDLNVRAPNGGTNRYRVFVTTGGVVTYVKPHNTHLGMAFGRAVAVAGTTLAVGAPDDKSVGTGPLTGDIPIGMTSTGAVFVYVRGDRWRREVTLKPSHEQAMMKFGASIAIAGDTLVVGAPGESGLDLKSSQAGAAFVFVRTGDTWSQQAYLKAADAAVGDEFGTSVAITTTTTPAGMATTTIAVGAPGAQGPNNAPRTGAVYMFVRTGSGPQWGQQAMPRPTNPKGNNEFGSSVALSGDTLVVGAPLEDSGATGVNPSSTGSTAADSGAAFVFTRNGTAWPQSSFIKAPIAAPFVNFGAKVAVAGNFLAISAPNDGLGARGDTSAGAGLPNSGAVWIYQRSGNGFAFLHNIKASNAHEVDHFGRGLALSPTTLVVGAPHEDTNGTGVVDPGPTNTALDSGATYVFRVVEGRWTELVRLKAPNAEGADNFGNAVATDGDTVVAGAEGESSGDKTINGNQSDNSALGSGAVYVY
jgi:trimeric autotransporter adhesin